MKRSSETKRTATRAFLLGAAIALASALSAATPVLAGIGTSM